MRDDSTAAHSASGESERQALINRLAKRAWFDPEFRELLLQDSRSALIREFGEVPLSLQDTEFRTTTADHAYVGGQGASRTFHIRPKRGERPTSLVVRDFLGEREAIIVLYTRRCAFQCSFCTLPSAGAFSAVATEETAAQLDKAREFVARTGNKVARIALGNEGSLLDVSTFPANHLRLAMECARTLPGAREIIIETRPEFVDEAAIARLESWRGDCTLTLKIGLESKDEHIRQVILDKRMSLVDFTAAISLAGVYGYALECYVILKAHPAHTDSEAQAEAILTCEYVKQLCSRAGVPLTLRINSMYMARGSRWARQASQTGWTPPSVFDIAEVMWAVRTPQVRVFGGVSEEGLATADGHFESRADFEPWALHALERFNATGLVADLASVALHRQRPRGQ